MVDVENDAGSIARAAAIAAAESIALQDPEAQLRGEGIARSSGTIAGRSSLPMGTSWAGPPVRWVTRSDGLAETREPVASPV
jgi:hypothetical protein